MPKNTGGDLAAARGALAEIFGARPARALADTDDALQRAMDYVETGETPSATDCCNDAQTALDSLRGALSDKYGATLDAVQKHLDEARKLL